jgi:hypothetical protein
VNIDKKPEKIIASLEELFYHILFVFYQIGILKRAQKNSPSVETEGHKRLLAI